MNCRDIEVLLQLYIDGELPAETKAQVESHIAACPTCAAELAAYEHLDALLRCGLSPVAPPEGFSARVLAALPAQAPPVAKPAPLRKPRRVRWLGVAVAAVLVLACVFGFGKLFGGPAELPVQIAEDGEQPRVTEPQQLEITRPSPIVAQNEPDEEQEPDDSPPPVTEPDQPDEQEPVVSQPGTISDTPPTEPMEPNTPPAEPQDGESGETLPDNTTTYTSIVDLPKVAYGGASHGSYALTLLAAVDGCDAMLPQIVDGVVYFYTELDEVFLEWQVDLAAKEAPFCLGQVELLPQAAGLGLDNGDGYFIAALYQQTAISGPDGLWLQNGGTEGEAPVQLAEYAGGLLLSWSPDGNKLLYTDEDGFLYVYYLAEQLNLAIHDTPVDSACWNTDSRTIVFSAIDLESGFDTISSVQVP